MASGGQGAPAGSRMSASAMERITGSSGLRGGGGGIGQTEGRRGGKGRGGRLDKGGRRLKRPPAAALCRASGAAVKQRSAAQPSPTPAPAAHRSRRPSWAYVHASSDSWRVVNAPPRAASRQRPSTASSSGASGMYPQDASARMQAHSSSAPSAEAWQRTTASTSRSHWLWGRTSSRASCSSSAVSWRASRCSGLGACGAAAAAGAAAGACGTAAGAGESAEAAAAPAASGATPAQRTDGAWRERPGRRGKRGSGGREVGLRGAAARRKP
jgi:hypothetical protein